MDYQLTQGQLQKMVPRCKAALWSGPLNAAFARFGINSKARACAFLAQVGHESADFTRLEENLNYSAEGLANTWRTRYAQVNIVNGKPIYPVDPKTKRYLPNALALSLHRRPEAIANLTYANRMGNGSPESGDGWRNRGRGLIQITGLSNYRAAGAALGLDLEGNPDLLLQPGPAALTAGWFWQSRGCNELADCNPGDHEDEDFRRITVLVNGGEVGLKDRRDRWKLALAA